MPSLHVQSLGSRLIVEQIRYLVHMTCWIQKYKLKEQIQLNSLWLDALKGIEKILRENAFEQKKEKPRLKVNPRVISANGPSNNRALGIS